MSLERASRETVDGLYPTFAEFISSPEAIRGISILELLDNIAKQICREILNRSSADQQNRTLTLKVPVGDGGELATLILFFDTNNQCIRFECTDRRLSLSDDEKIAASMAWGLSTFS